MKDLSKKNNGRIRYQLGWSLVANHPVFNYLPIISSTRSDQTRFVTNIISMNQPSSGLTPQEESNTTHQVLATETETLEKATETNSPENSVTAAVQPEVTPEEH
ncbi:hypothetical protein YC2023_023081 [Brassica napus]